MISSVHPTRVRLTCSLCSFLCAAALLLLPAGVRAQVHTHSTGTITTDGTLPQNIPDFCANATIRSVSSGAWSNPSIWSPARVPGASDVVNVAAGTTVTYDIVSSTTIPCLAVNGQLVFRNDLSTRLTVGTLMI